MMVSSFLKPGIMLTQFNKTCMGSDAAESS